MPQIDLIPESLYQSFHPYHHLFDNMPLRNILARIGMVNDVVDIDHSVLTNCTGTAGSLDARLDASLNPDGSLQTTAVDLALHSIGEHTDTSDQSEFLESGDEFVRMTERERAKLDLIQDEANLLNIRFETASPSNTPVDFTNGTLILADSVSTAWRWEAGKMYLDLAFPVESAHTHFYDITPNNPSGDLQTYYVPLDYIEGSLRVYVNGTRLSEDGEIYHPGYIPTAEWTLNKFTVDESDTTMFTLDNELNENDVIKIDFIQSYT